MPASDYRPSVDDIGARMYARTLDLNGQRSGTFTNTTLPSATQVSTLIDDALATVSGQIGADLPEKVWPLAKVAVIYSTAMAIERGYFPETTESTDSAYAAYGSAYGVATTALTTALNEDQPNEQEGWSVPLRRPHYDRERCGPDCEGRCFPGLLCSQLI